MVQVAKKGRKKPDRISYFCAYTYTAFIKNIQLARDAIITSSLRQNDVATSFRHNDDVIFASWVSWGFHDTEN